MKVTRILMYVATIILCTAAQAGAQVTVRIKPNAQESSQSNTIQDDDQLIRAIFDPITDDLKLTPIQKLRIANVASVTMAEADPLFERLDALDAELSLGAFTGSLDEAKIKQFSDKQAALLGEIIALKARAKANFYKMLTAEQRGIIINQYRLRDSESLGSISNRDY